MIELIFVIVVIGIITAVMLPRIDRDNVYEAAQQLESHLKYAQHLSMIDNAYDDASPTWYRNRWGVYFDTVTTRYGIKKSTDGASTWKFAKDPVTGTDISGAVDSSTDLLDKFNITSITSPVGNSCNTKKIMYFDSLGRPYTFTNVPSAAPSPQSGLISTDCEITLNSSGHNATITVKKETGYISITAFN